MSGGGRCQAEEGVRRRKVSGGGRCQAEEGRRSGGRVERPADKIGMEEEQKGERPPYKGGYTKGSGGRIRMRRV